MRVYFDVFSNDEMLSDSYPIVSIHNDVVFEVQSSLTTKGGEKIDIGRSEATYAIAGAERDDAGDEEDKVEDVAESVIDLVDKFGLNITQYTKKEYTVYIKAYMQKLKKHLMETNPERVDGFQKGATDFIKFVMGRFDEFKFYSGTSYDTEAMYVLSCYKQDSDPAPVFYFFADGLRHQEY